MLTSERIYIKNPNICSLQREYTSMGIETSDHEHNENWQTEEIHSIIWLSKPLQDALED